MSKAILASQSVQLLFDLPSMKIPYVEGGRTLAGMDCVGLLRYWLMQNGIDCPYKNTHDFCRNMLYDFQPISGIVPVGAVVAIWKQDGAPSRYNDDFGNVTHVYVKIGDGTLLHASEGNQTVLTRDFADKAIPNGGPTHFAFVKGLDYNLVRDEDNKFVEESADISGNENAPENAKYELNQTTSATQNIVPLRYVRVQTPNGGSVKIREKADLGAIYKSGNEAPNGRILQLVDSKVRNGFYKVIFNNKARYVDARFVVLYEMV